MAKGKRTLGLINFGICVVAVISLVGLLFCNYSVLTRLIAVPSPWSDELLKAAFIWVFFLSIAFACNEDKLVGITILEEKLISRKNKTVYKLLKTFQYAITLFLAGFITYYGFSIMASQFKVHELTPVLCFPTGMITLGFVLGCAIWTLFSVTKLVTLWRTSDEFLGRTTDEINDANEKT